MRQTHRYDSPEFSDKPSCSTACHNRAPIESLPLDPLRGEGTSEDFLREKHNLHVWEGKTTPQFYQELCSRPLHERAGAVNGHRAVDLATEKAGTHLP